MNDLGVFRGPLVSAFGTPKQFMGGSDKAGYQYLEWMARTGFLGGRLFVGNLTWQDQIAADARKVLRPILRAAKSFGLQMMVCPLTDTGVGPAYNEADAVRECFDICGEEGNGFIDVGQEYWHPTQNERVRDVNNLRRWGANGDNGRGIPWCCGAAEIDELTTPDKGSVYPGAGGTFNGPHLRRDHYYVVQMAHIREQEAISAKYNNGISNKEPIGWDEKGTDRVVVSRSRIDDPEAFFYMGALSQVYGLLTVGHGQHALRSELPGPNQQACAEALIRGIKSIPLAPTDPRPEFRHGHWDNTPMSGRFYAEAEEDSARKGNLVRNRVWRVTSAIMGTKARVVVGGMYDTANPDGELMDKNGWQRIRLIDEMKHTQVWEMQR